MHVDRGEFDMYYGFMRFLNPEPIFAPSYVYHIDGASEHSPSQFVISGRQAILQHIRNIPNGSHYG